MSTRRVRSDRMLERTAAAAVSRSRARARSPRCPPVAEAPATVKDVAASSWTGPSCRLAAIRRRSAARGVDRSLEELDALLLGAADPPHQVPHDRGDDEDEEHQAARGHAGEAAPQLAGPGAHGVVGGVDLEQGDLPVGGPHRPVHLDGPLVVLEGVLAAVQVRHLGHGGRLLEGLALVLGEREGPADQLPLVGVDDPPVGGPQLDPHDRVAEELVARDDVERRERRRVTR